MKHVDQEGTRRLKTVFQPHEGRLYVQQDSHEFEKDLADQNARLRQAEQTGTGNVRLHLQMSEQDYEQLLQRHPVLRTGSTRQRRAIWEKIAKQRPDLVAMEFKQRLFAAGAKT